MRRLVALAGAAALMASCGGGGGGNPGDAVTEMFESDEYAALIPLRDKGFAEMNILVTRTL